MMSKIIYAIAWLRGWMHYLITGFGDYAPNNCPDCSAKLLVRDWVVIDGEDNTWDICPKCDYSTLY